MLMSCWVTELIPLETLFSAKVIPIKLFFNHSPFQNSRIGRAEFVQVDMHFHPPRKFPRNAQEPGTLRSLSN